MYDTDLLPDRYREEVEDFILYGKRPGDLLMAICENNLLRAMKIAYAGNDPEQHQSTKLLELVAWMFWKAPAGCLANDPTHPEWGPEHWIESGGHQARTPPDEFEEDVQRQRDLRNIFGELDSFEKTVTEFYRR